MDQPWFDSKSGVFLLDEYVAVTPSFQTIRADSVVTVDQLREQAERVTALFQDLERRLTPEDHARVTEALCELAVLHALRLKHLSYSQ